MRRLLVVLLFVAVLWSGGAVGWADDVRPGVWEAKAEALRWKIAQASERQKTVEERAAVVGGKIVKLEARVQGFARNAYVGSSDAAVGPVELKTDGRTRAVYLGASLTAQKAVVDNLVEERARLVELHAEDEAVGAVLQKAKQDVDQVVGWIHENEQTAAVAVSHAELLPTGPAATAPDPGAVVAVAYATAQLGKPYRFATHGPLTYDCSGLTGAAWAAAGVPLPFYSGAQYEMTQRIERSELLPGDLVFVGYRGSQHVEIYVGGDRVISAPHTGSFVRVQTLRDSASGYGRVIR